MRYSLFIFIALIVIYACKKDKPAGNEPAGKVPCVPAALVGNTLAFYNFAGGSLSDFSGNGHHLSNPSTASPVPDRMGNTICAYGFKAAANDYLFTSNASFLDNRSALSISLWYNAADSSRPGGDYEVLISRDTSGSCPDRYGQWSVALYDCRRAVFGHINSIWDLLITNTSCAGEVNARTGSWHHLAACWNNNTATMTLYRDGVLQASSTGAGACNTTPVVLDKGNLYIGKFFTGSIDDIIILDKELTAAEVQELATLAPCCSQ